MELNLIPFAKINHLTYQRNVVIGVLSAIIIGGTCYLWYKKKKEKKEK